MWKLLIWPLVLVILAILLELDFRSCDPGFYVATCGASLIMLYSILILDFIVYIVLLLVIKWIGKYRNLPKFISSPFCIGIASALLLIILFPLTMISSLYGLFIYSEIMNFIYPPKY
jgi:hypothetical protein